MSCTEARQQPETISAGATTVIALDPAGHRRGSTEGDLECLVCRESYNCARSPKLLSCQHTFCAVCLKLLLYVQEDTWSITCPLCRKVTAVPGGLICSLRDQEAVVGQLALTCPESARQLALHQESILPRTEAKPDCFHCLRAPRVSAVLTSPTGPWISQATGYVWLLCIAGARGDTPELPPVSLAVPCCWGVPPGPSQAGKDRNCVEGAPFRVLGPKAPGESLLQQAKLGRCGESRSGNCSQHPHWAGQLGACHGASS